MKFLFILCALLPLSAWAQTDCPKGISGKYVAVGDPPDVRHSITIEQYGCESMTFNSFGNVHDISIDGKVHNYPVWVEYYNGADGATVDSHVSYKWVKGDLVRTHFDPVPTFVWYKQSGPREVYRFNSDGLLVYLSIMMERMGLPSLA